MVVKNGTKKTLDKEKTKTDKNLAETIEKGAKYRLFSGAPSVVAKKFQKMPYFNPFFGLSLTIVIFIMQIKVWRLLLLPSSRSCSLSISQLETFPWL